MRNKDDSSGDLFAQAGENIPDDAGNKAGSADDGQTPQPARPLSSPSLVEQFAAEHQKQALSLESPVNQEAAEAHGSPDASGSGGLMDVADGGSQPPVEDGNGASGGGNDEDGVPLHVFAERAYLTYAMSTVLDRALPFIEDGQKPVQRRILYAMRELGSRHDVPFKKSARIVGDVIGKFHPHGDSAVYEAAVRMAQDFTLRYPLIEGQGNFGSRDGDQAAAMRYTEIRLSRFAEDILLGELDRGTVDYRENYDGTLKEPALLPARLPVLLLNGVSGIAVGMATEMQPHNLREVAAACIAVLQAGQGGQNSETDAVTVDEAIYAAIPGPDFPGGAQLISSREDIRKAYETGRGSLRLRARWEVEPLARGQYRVAITELPPNTNTARVLAEIEELTNPKVKSGKKSLTSDQQNLKNAALAVLDAFRDDSDRAHPVRIVLEPRSRTVSSDDLVNFLLANTSLESNVAVNMTMIGRDGRPQQKSLPRIVHEWCEYRLTVIERRLRHRHTEVERRLHILDGRMIAFLHIDEVIRIIRESDDAKLEMKIRFGLTDTQVEDILEIRLRQLARLEGIRIEKEIAELKTERDGLNHLLGSENARRQLAIEEIEKDAARYGDARRTRIETAEKVTAARVEVTSDDPVTILLSKNGFIRCRSGHGIDRSLLNWKDGDGERAIVETRTVHPIILFDASGRAYTLKAADLPGGKGDGVPLTSLLDLGGSIVGMVSAPAEARVLMASSAGVGFIGTIADMTARNRAGKAYMSIDEGARLLPPVLMPDNVQYMAALAEASLPRLLVFPIDEMKALSGGKGVILIGLDAARHEQLLAACAFDRRVAVTGIGRGDKESEILVGPGEKENDLAHYLGKRARKGKALPPRLKRISGLKAVVEAVQANKMDAAAPSEKPSGLPQPAIGTGVASPEAGNTLLDLPGVDDDTGNAPPENES